MGEIETLGSVCRVDPAACPVEELRLESVWAPDPSIGDGTTALAITMSLATTAGSLDATKGVEMPSKRRSGKATHTYTHNG